MYGVRDCVFAVLNEAPAILILPPKAASIQNLMNQSDRTRKPAFLSFLFCFPNQRFGPHKDDWNARDSDCEQDMLWSEIGQSAPPSQLSV